MSLWRRLRERLGGAKAPGGAPSSRSGGGAGDDVAPPAGERGRAAGGARAAAGASAPPRARPAPRGGDAGDDVARLRSAGTRAGPTTDEVIAILRRARGTLREADAVAQLVAAMEERVLPDPVRVACADLLAARGDEQGALRVLEGAALRDAVSGPRAARAQPVSSTAGLVLAADLYAAMGQLPRALGAIERVLVREIGAPGARERHQRWRAALGAERPAAPRSDDVTVVAPSAARSPFRLLREVARGGAGVVYEAEDDVLGRRVGFKVYHGRGGDRSHLTREARLAAALAGPGIVRVFDADPDEGWIALEWIPRGSVRDVLRSGDAAALAPIARWARPLARALARIHERGYVHADVKPANVLLRELGEPVLTDFGLARPLGAPSAGGSPGYVSPERLAGRPSDPRDDVYGYGRVLEDVLVRLEPVGAEDLSPWKELSLRCLGPDHERPQDGAALVRAAC
ncbi:serine/threonine-protein kinase [Sorangium sp. So ce131]|uniref:serine/threonine-protein kinase n=1 Tax=Sorangium sp. So ce131 TaxID=3133282 RepID=UPI003F5F6569